LLVVAAGVAAAAAAASSLWLPLDWGFGNPSNQAASDTSNARRSKNNRDDGHTVRWESIGRKACGIRHAPNFLTEAEIVHVLGLVEQAGG
jgi:hypothetical protein